MSATSSPPMPPLAIIGLGCLFPGSTGRAGFWASVVNKVDAIRDVPPSHWSAADYLDADPKSPDRVYSARGGFLDPVPFPPGEFGIAPNNLEATDSSQLLGLLVAQQALEDCGYSIGPANDRKAIDRSRVSVILGVTGTLQLVIPLGARLGHPLWRKALREAGVDDATADDVVQRIADGYVPWQENSFPGLLGNVVAGRIANRLDLGGTNCVVDAACASSLGAVHLAGLELATGRADVVLTGGVDCFNDIFMFTCFSKTPALSPTGSARPFDADGDGTVLGEGLGVVVLKRLEDARRDGDRVYAVLRGIGSSSDGKGGAIYAPRKEGQIEALRAAYRSAGITPDTVELVEAHGTGTKVGDATEISALAEVYRTTGRDGAWAAVGSIKSQIGHTKAAAGAAGLIKAALALHHKVLPPTIKVSRPLDVLRDGPLYVNTERRPWMPTETHPRRAAVSAFGFGGSNFHCVLEEADPVKQEIDWVGDVELIAFSGATADDLSRQAAAWPRDLAWDDLCRRADESRRAFRSDAAARMVLVVDRGNVAQRLEQAKALKAGDGVHIGQGPAAGKLAVLFPGQGAQAVGMLREVVCHFPAAFEVFADFDRYFARETGRRLVDLVYPPPAFDEAARARQEETLRATDAAQPALGAVTLGAWRTLERFGVRADAFAGHSYGELVALAAAGRITADELARLSLLRGRLMAQAGGGDAGAMLAVKATQERIIEVLREAGLDLVLANRNAPEQTVLSGPTAAIHQARESFARHRIGATPLPVAAAFHSPLVAGAREPFRRALADVAITAGASVYANSSAAPYPDGDDARDLLAGQLARPVEWVRSVEAMYAAGARSFLEVGPGGRLTPLVEATLRGKEAACRAVGPRPGFADVADALAWLAARGHAVRLDQWHPAAGPAPRKHTMTVPISGINHVRPREPRPPRPHPAQPPSSPALTNGTAKPTMTQPRPQPTPTPAPDQSALAQALALTRESLTALQRMQETSAALHRQFLDGQDAAHRTVAQLVEQQQRLLLGATSAPLPAMAPLPAPAALPTPVVPGGRGGVFDAPVERPAAPDSPGLRKASAPATQAPVVTPPPPAVKAAGQAQAVLLEVVSEKTGYPADMLELGMSLDADLGIDSIKRVEILSALQERLPDAPQVKPEHLGSLHTLADVAAFLGDRLERGDASPLSSGLDAGTSAGDETKLKAGMHPRTPNSEAQAVLLEVVSEKTGYPADMLELGMSLDADLGIDSIKRVEILSALQERLPDAPPVKPEHLGSLHTLADVAAFLAPGPREVAQTRPPQPAQAAPERPAPASLERTVVHTMPLTAPRARRELSGEAWVAGDDNALSAALARRGLTPKLLPMVELACATPPERLAALVLPAPAAGVDETWLRDALFAVQSVGPALRAARGVLLTVSRLDGGFGLIGSPARDPLDGALAGLAKTVGHEWPEVQSRALDVSPALSTEQTAEAVAEELFLTGLAEVGISARGLVTLERRAEPVRGGDFVPFRPGDLVVLSGGARGVTAEAAFALARRFRPTLLLLGRSPEPTAEPDWLAALPDEAALKRELARRTPGATPRAVGEQARAVLAGREVRHNLERLRQAGARAVYRSVDVRDAATVADVLREARQTYGPVRGLVHGAGVLADARIEDKTPAQFDAVWQTKVGGVQALLAAVEDDDLRAMVLFSSSTARFGRTGQVDYAMANEALNKLAWREAGRRPGCRVVSLNWGPWDGGMVTPALRQLFAKEGVGVIPLADGAELMAAELTNGPGGPREVVVLAAESRPAAPAPPAVPLPAAFERKLTVDDYPILAHHVLDGRPVLPFALTLEWLAHAAVVQGPGLTFHGLDDARMLHGVVLDDGAVTVRVGAAKAVRRDGLFVAAAELRSTRNGKDVPHARADVLLTAALPPAPEPLAVPGLPPYALAAEEVYRRGLLFHGEALHAIAAVEGMGEAGAAARLRGGSLPARWMRQPLRQQWLTDPLALDGCFQLMILWSRHARGAASLPVHVRRYRQFRRSYPADGCRVVLSITKSSAHAATADLDLLDATGAVIARIEGYECVIDASLERAFGLNRLVGA